jgi:hypothetical protein
VCCCVDLHSTELLFVAAIAKVANVRVFGVVVSVDFERYSCETERCSSDATTQKVECAGERNESKPRRGATADSKQTGKQFVCFIGNALCRNSA